MLAPFSGAYVEGHSQNKGVPFRIRTPISTVVLIVIAIFRVPCFELMADSWAHYNATLLGGSGGLSKWVNNGDI